MGFFDRGRKAPAVDPLLNNALYGPKVVGTKVLRPQLLQDRNTTPEQLARFNAETDDYNMKRQQAKMGGLTGGSSIGGTGISSFLDTQDDYIDRSRGKDSEIWDKIFGAGGSSDRIQGDASSFRDFSRLGAADEESLNRLRGGGVYEDFAKGLSAEEMENRRARGQRTVSSIFGSYGRQNDQRNTIRNGTAGYSGQQRQLARDAAHEGRSAALDTEAGISADNERRRAAGAAGMAGTEQNVTANQLGALGAAGNLETALMGGTAGMYGQVSSEERARAQKLQAMGLDQNLILALLGLQQNNEKPSPFEQYVLPAIGTAADVGSSYLPGGKRNKNTGVSGRG